MNKIYLNILYGLLLGQSVIFNNNKTLTIKIEGKHISYMTDIHKKISDLGYCEQKFPKIITKLGKKGKLNKLMLLDTYPLAHRESSVSDSRGFLRPLLKKNKPRPLPPCYPLATRTNQVWPLYPDSLGRWTETGYHGKAWGAGSSNPAAGWF